ncbi:40S ribosomal protein S3 [Spraguea lophii 42_110]|uniref:40S ribosomal protein S3 n=1 Tax=Spraguea lophii (strain 42_110) TaxID=1358809 RepID=S7WAW0_SPRLO|nr:Chain SD0, 40S ribosomal protein S3 [Spraguea lophii 42_110]7QJH_RD0 Chain RD0, 40S ribosomal protein S3 [Spraguea lophii 42_110]7QJH_SD0 Chain SD0, 40S ribosomal protein S3 [Spraguea lophii 42_110]8BR3_SD0 Chain SD0, 40S ribosomal protein S3 [Spraguea lophii 42_110]8P5D_SD0 Chain SD0, 40S ribosomal protein S3 [Spraguea lophii 42_110]8P60_RD0 Chain RD0, 40S ribosomal protein S3 [Spraguea lophii 42_110]8P60_SD0 Chain SD0, 40S ribosomal protein S3 [Spraguea lophii 42_110]EPR78917.1 40S ribo
MQNKSIFPQLIFFNIFFQIIFFTLMFNPEASSIKNRFVERGCYYAEINEFLSKLLQKEGFSGLSLRLHERPIRVVIRLEKTTEVLKDNSVLLKQIKALIGKRLQEDVSNIDILIEMVKNKGLCPAIQAEFIRSKFEENIPYRRSVVSAIKNIKSAGGQGCVIEVSGKLKGQRARSVKTIDGKIIHAGQPKEEFMRYATTSVLLKQGIIGIKVGIMLPQDDEGIKGPVYDMVDKIKVLPIKEE